MKAMLKLLVSGVVGVLLSNVAVANSDVSAAFSQCSAGTKFEKDFSGSYYKLEKAYKLIAQGQFQSAKEVLDRVVVFFNTSSRAGFFEGQEDLVSEMLSNLRALRSDLSRVAGNDGYTVMIVDARSVHEKTDYLYLDLLPACAQ